MQTRDTDRLWLPHSLLVGIGLAAATAVISGIAVYLNSQAVKELNDATLFTTLKNGVAAALLTALLMAKPAARRAIRSLTPRQWLGLAALGVVGGSLPFLLFFNGLAMASAPSAAFIHKTLFIWVALLATPLLNERLGWPQLAALGMLLGSQLLIAHPTGVEWGGGETLIAAATGLWAVEVVVARRLLRSVPSTVGAAGRMTIGFVVLGGYAILSGRLGAISGLTATEWLWIVGTGLLLTVYVAAWYAALRRAPATLVTSILVAGAPITAILSSLGAGAIPATGVLAGFGLALVGVVSLGWVAVHGSRPLGAATHRTT